MTAPTPPPNRDDRDLEVRLELAHASADGELTPEESAAILPDERWRALVEEARQTRDSVRAALVLPDPDNDRRESHLAAALDHFDTLAPSTAASPDPPSPTGPTHAVPPPPGAVAGDELAQRRNARTWVSKVPISIAAAILAAVVILGSTQLRDDDGGDEDTTSLASTDDSANAEGAEPSEPDTALDSHSSAEAAADSPSATSGTDEKAVFTLTVTPGSLDAFSESVAATGRGGSDIPSSAVATDRLDLPPDCTKDDILDLLRPGVNSNEVTLVEGVVEGRDVVGMVPRTDPNDVIVIDLGTCEVVADR